MITVSAKNGFASAVQLTCSVTGPSPMPTCAFSPTSVTPVAPALLLQRLRSQCRLSRQWLYRTVLRRLPNSYMPRVDSYLFGITLVGGLGKKRLNTWALGSFLALATLLTGVMCRCKQQQSIQPTKSYIVTIVANSADFGFDSPQCPGGSHGPVASR